jgi:hypothetical protein
MPSSNSRGFAPPLADSGHRSSLDGFRGILGLLACWAAVAAAQEPWTGSAAADPPPMYLAEPNVGGSLAGMPTAVIADPVTPWPRWFAGASGLVMTRTLPAGAPTMVPLGATALSTSDASASWPGGIDLHLGRWFGSGQHHAVEFIYWGVYGIGSSAGVTADPPAIDTLPVTPGVVLAGLPAADFLLDARGQVVGRSDLINDLEINWVYAPWDRPEFLPRRRAFNLMWLAGFRFFQLEDRLTLATLPGDASLGPAVLALNTNNNLYGGQVGAKLDWRFLPSVRLTAVPKFLVAGNAISNLTTLADATGTEAVFASGDPVRGRSTLGVFSWLGSIDTGLAWDVTDRWSLSLGYRVVGVGNVAQADGQWPLLLATPADLAGIAAGSSTIVHGGFAGFEARY